jgi:DNA polymerase-3 subunit epsilon
MTRQIVLDTETTGLEVSRGHRVIEIGCVELIERRRTGRVFHRYLNPGRAVDEGALAVHGLSDAFLADKPPFAAVVDDWLAFIGGAELIIHNAVFDVAFLDAELGLLPRPRGRVADHAGVVDTLALARERYPGQKNSLDALCKRLGVDNAHRELHGALLDASLLADVYLAMTAGQVALDLALEPTVAESAARVARSGSKVATLRRHAAPIEDIEAHERRLDALDRTVKGACLWRRSEAAAPVASA